MCSVLDKLATKCGKIFQLHLRHTTLQKLTVACFDKLKWNDVNVSLLLQLVSFSNRYK